MDRRPAPRYYGAVPTGPAFVLGCVLLVAAILALVAGSTVVGLVLLVLTVAAFSFFFGAARRSPASPVARRVFRTADQLRGWSRFTRESTTAWTRALREVVRLRGESRRLRREREKELRSLGEAAYQEDEPAVSALREQLREIDDELTKRAKAQAETLSKARRHVDEEHAAAQPTRRFSVDEISSGGDTKD